MSTEFVLDALEQALHARQREGELIRHSDRGSQYLSIRYSERMAEARIEPSEGSMSGSYDKALVDQGSLLKPSSFQVSRAGSSPEQRVRSLRPWLHHLR